MAQLWNQSCKNRAVESVLSEHLVFLIFLPIQCAVPRSMSYTAMYSVYTILYYYTCYDRTSVTHPPPPLRPKCSNKMAHLFLPELCPCHGWKAFFIKLCEMVISLDEGLFFDNHSKCLFIKISVIIKAKQSACLTWIPTCTTFQHWLLVKVWTQHYYSCLE